MFKNFASIIEPDALRQGQMTARLAIVEGVALMPDAHVGLGATVGSVIATRNAIIPAAVGVDVGCGMAAVRLAMSASSLPDNLAAFMSYVEQAVPAGLGQGHESGGTTAARVEDVYAACGRPATELIPKQEATMAAQWGSLGSGNHFFEMTVDEQDRVWLVIHSGSRGIGNQLARQHIRGAQDLMKLYRIQLEDPDLAYLVHDTPQFDSYMQDLAFGQRYAFTNRDRMLTAVMRAMNRSGLFPAFTEEDRVNCHHNYTAKESHFGRNVYVTRKGAIRARASDRGIIPGSMGSDSYIVQGREEESSYHSAPHGAGRRLSRRAAKATIPLESFEDRMAGKVWLSDMAAILLDEHPDAYKDINVVLEDSKDLITVLHHLKAVLNYKGV